MELSCRVCRVWFVRCLGSAPGVGGCLCNGDGDDVSSVETLRPWLAWVYQGGTVPDRFSHVKCHHLGDKKATVEKTQRETSGCVVVVGRHVTTAVCVVGACRACCTSISIGDGGPPRAKPDQPGRAANPTLPSWGPQPPAGGVGAAFGPWADRSRRAGVRSWAQLAGARLKANRLFFEFSTLVVDKFFPSVDRKSSMHCCPRRRPILGTT